MGYILVEGGSRVLSCSCLLDMFGNISYLADLIDRAWTQTLNIVKLLCFVQMIMLLLSRIQKSIRFVPCVKD